MLLHVFASKLAAFKNMTINVLTVVPAIKRKRSLSGRLISDHCSLIVVLISNSLEFVPSINSISDV